jgi:hypothetical protein
VLQALRGQAAVHSSPHRPRRRATKHSTPALQD